MIRTLCQVGFSGLIAVLMIGGPLAYKQWHDRQYRNFRIVEEGILYRSGQLPIHRLNELVLNYGIRTVVCLRDGTDPVDQEEEHWVDFKGLKFVRLPPKQWYPDASGAVPAEENLQKFRAVMDDPANYPVLVHCFAGIHRTGTMCAIYRMDYQGWTNDEAMAEMRSLGYSILDEHEDVHGFLKQYRPPHTLVSKPLPIAPASRQNGVEAEVIDKAEDR